MKAIVANLFLLIMTTQDVWSQNIFVKTYDNCWAGVFTAQTSDMGFIIAGSRGPTIYLVKTNASGNKLWTRNIIDQFGTTATVIKQTTDGGYILTGMIHESGGITGAGYGDVLILKLDSIGNIRGRTILGNKDSKEWGTGILLGKDNNFYVCGSIGINGLLVKLNNVGDTLWLRKYETISAVYGILDSGDGNLLLSSTKKNLGIFIVKVDQEGKILTEKRITDNCNLASVPGFQKSPDGNYIILEEKHEPQPRWLLSKFSGEGNLIWEKFFEGDHQIILNSFNNCQDGGIILTGSIEKEFEIPSKNVTRSSSDVILIKTNHLGETLWTRIFSGYGNDIGYYVSQTTDGGFIISGSTRGFYDYLSGDLRTSDQIFLIKTDSNGKTAWPPWESNSDHHLPLNEKN
ncbi:MAG: hypothetical protein IH946_06470 [Bacteroidetes bacterium]|nr:hypothetical protein [Bacteroidota bacterium]